MSSAAAMDAGARASTAPQPEPEAAPEAAAPAPAVTETPAPKAKTPTSGGPSGMKELAAATAEGVAAEREKANLASVQADSLMAQQQANAKAMTDTTKEWNDRWRASQDRADALAQSIANDKVDPNRLWNGSSTGGKIAASIGMILGGIGSGITGGPNQALQVMQAAINRDVDAQKMDLGKKQGLLSHYVEQGHSVMEASRLAKADAMDAAAGQIALVKTKFLGATAHADADSNIATLHKQAAMERQTVYGEGLRNQLTAIQLEQAKQQLALAPDMQRIKIAAESGQPLPIEARAFMDPKRTVALPSGKVAYANTDADRDELAKVNQALTSGRSAIQRVRSLGGTTGIGGTDSQRGRAAIIDLQNAYQAILDRSNAPRGAQEEDMKQAFSNPTVFWRSKGSIDKQMDLAEDMFKKHAAAAYKARLVNPAAAAGI